MAYDYNEESVAEYVGRNYPHLYRFFFAGRDTDIKDMSDNNPAKDHIWIARHDTYDTLTIETFDPEHQRCTGQYEIAVRMKTTHPEDDCGTRFPGYHVSEKGGFMVGQGTGGH